MIGAGDSVASRQGELIAPRYGCHIRYVRVKLTSQMAVGVRHNANSDTLPTTARASKRTWRQVHVGAHLSRIALFLRLFLRALEVLGHEVLACELHVVRVMIDPLMVL